MKFEYKFVIVPNLLDKPQEEYDKVTRPYGVDDWELVEFKGWGGLSVMFAFKRPLVVVEAKQWPDEKKIETYSKPIKAKS